MQMLLQFVQVHRPVNGLRVATTTCKLLPRKSNGHARLQAPRSQASEPPILQAHPVPAPVFPTDLDKPSSQEGRFFNHRASARASRIRKWTGLIDHQSSSQSVHLLANKPDCWSRYSSFQQSKYSRFPEARIGSNSSSIRLPEVFANHWIAFKCPAG